MFARIYTYGKAMGVHGAAIVGSQLLRDYLINFSRPFCFTTAMPLHSVMAIACAYELVAQADDARQRLYQNIAIFQTSLENKGVSLPPSQTPIQAIIVPGNDKVRACAARLAAKGFDIRPIMSPTVKRGQEMLRLCLHAFNTGEEVAELADLLALILKENQP